MLRRYDNEKADNTFPAYTTKQAPSSGSLSLLPCPGIRAIRVHACSIKLHSIMGALGGYQFNDEDIMDVIGRQINLSTTSSRMIRPAVTKPFGIRSDFAIYVERLHGN